jgi:hypothetical protein
MWHVPHFVGMNSGAVLPGPAELLAKFWRSFPAILYVLLDGFVRRAGNFSG